jgi:Anti-sigma-K factor rskA
MTGGACPERDDLVAYSIGALEPDEERSVEAHLPGCERCTRELRALAPAVAVLAESVEQFDPPPELRERVLSTVREEAERPEARAAGARERRGLSRLVLRPAAGLAALAVVGAGVTGYLIRDEEGDGGGTETVPVSASGISGSLSVSDDTAMLEVNGMPQLAGRAVYQVWVDEGGTIKPGPSFVPDRSGAATTGVREALDSGDRVLVTREPGPGRTTPSGSPLLTARVD